MNFVLVAGDSSPTNKTTVDALNVIRTREDRNLATKVRAKTTTDLLRFSFIFIFIFIFISVNT